MMSSNKSIASIEVFSGSNNWYYTMLGQNYDIRFPLEYALIAQASGGLCSDCLAHGCINGVFVGFCAKCIDNKYGFARGNGMELDCIERTGQYFDPKYSIWATYMKTRLNYLGDKNEVGCEKLRTAYILKQEALAQE